VSATDAGAVPAGEGMPALTVSWDGNQTLTVTETSDGTTAAVFSGQALANGVPPEQVVSALSPDGHDPQEALLT